MARRSTPEGRQQKSFCRRSCCVCVEQHIFSQTQIEADCSPYQQWAECRKLGTMVSVQPATGKPGMQASTLPFDEQEDFCRRVVMFRQVAFKKIDVTMLLLLMMMMMMALMLWQHDLIYTFFHPMLRDEQDFDKTNVLKLRGSTFSL